MNSFLKDLEINKIKYNFFNNIKNILSLNSYSSVLKYNKKDIIFVMIKDKIKTMIKTIVILLDRMTA